MLCHKMWSNVGAPIRISTGELAFTFALAPVPVSVNPDHGRATNASKDMSDHTDRLLALAEDVSEGDKVEWDSQGDRKARGIVQRVAEEGSIDVPDSDFTVEAPAALIEVYEPTGDGHTPTGDMVGHQLETLGQTDFSVAEEEAADIALSDMQRLHITRRATRTIRCRPRASPTFGTSASWARRRRP